MKEYHKIQSLFKRDHETKKIIEGDYSIPEFKYLKDNYWVFTEKVDGMNIRIMIENGEVTFGGRTDRAQIPAELINHLNHIKEYIKDLGNIFKSDAKVCLYGEGYGAKIQKGGGNYSDKQKFVLFDININGVWLDRLSIEEIAMEYGIEIIPIVCGGTLDFMVEKCKKGFESFWGTFEAEGFVGRPAVELQNRNGERIITKLKTKDFR